MIMVNAHIQKLQKLCCIKTGNYIGPIKHCVDQNKKTEKNGGNTRKEYTLIVAHDKYIILAMESIVRKGPNGVLTMLSLMNKKMDLDTIMI